MTSQVIRGMWRSKRKQTFIFLGIILFKFTKIPFDIIEGYKYEEREKMKSRMSVQSRRSVGRRNSQANPVSRGKDERKG